MNNSTSRSSAQGVSEEQVARGFIDSHLGDLIYDHSAKSWYRWTGNRWAPDQTEATIADIRNHIGKYGDKAKPNLRSASAVNGVARLARTDQRISVTADAWDADPLLLGTPDGTIDLRDGSLQQTDSDDMITKLAAIGPADTVDCLPWLKFLDEATGNDPDTIAFLQRICGYILTGDTSEQLLVFIYGPGGNGKSKFINTVLGILADYAKPAAMDTFTSARFERQSNDLAMLQGARFVTASETGKGSKWSESRIKQLTGGDPITTRFLYREFFTYLPQFKLVLVGNYAPQLGQVDDAIRRRFLIVPFTRKPEVPDKKLEEKLKAEWPDILRWMIVGCLQWQAGGLRPPAAVTTATQEYFEQEDVFGQWLDECCELDRDAVVWVKEAFQSWKNYAESRGHDPGNERSFSAAMAQKELKKGKRVIDGEDKKSWIGIRLRGSE